MPSYYFLIPTVLTNNNNYFSICLKSQCNLDSDNDQWNMANFQKNSALDLDTK
jgi:hypothetical protein